MKILLKLSILLFLLFFVFQNSYSQQNINGWFWVNGQPQSNDLNWIQILDASHYFAAGDNGTFMKSSDGGDTWIINSQAGVPDPAYGSGSTYRLYSGWFFDENNGIVTGQSVYNQQAYIRRTTNGGESFSSIGLGVGAGAGVSRVNDICFINSATGYICGNNNIKAMKTTDGGLSWIQMPNLPIASYTYNSMYAVDENNIYLGLESEGVHRKIVRTSNGGATWIDQTLPGSTAMTVNGIEFQNLNTGYICGSGSVGNLTYFAFTTDAGANWTQAVFPNNNFGLKDLKIIGSNVYTLNSFNSYYYTSDLGVTWDSVNYGDPSNIYQPVISNYNAFDINGSDIITVGLFGKMNVSNDGGSSWRNKNYTVDYNNYCFSSVYALRGTQKVWAGAFGGGLILYSTNRGTNWTLIQTSAPESFEDIEMTDANTGYAAGGNINFGGYCYKTTNGGANWSPTAPLPTPTIKSNGLSFVNSNTGWVFGGSPFGNTNQISKTTNGGATWFGQPFSPTNGLPINDGDMANASTGYCVGSKIYKTTNGGSNWNAITTLPSGLNWSIVQTFSPSTLYLGGSHRIYKSFDGGLTWDSVFIPSTLPSIANMDWVDLNNGTVVGTAGYTAKTTDGGMTWSERNTGTSTLTGVSMANKDTVFAACDRNVWGAVLRLYDIPSNITTLNLTVGIEGFWNGNTQVSDTVKCHLRNSVSPFAEIEVASAVTDNSGYGSFNFSSPLSGSYYLEITHRNSLETWNASPIVLSTGGSYNYNFTTSASQAYGNNLILTSGRYCDYSGDVTQEGSVDLNDVVDVNNAS
ncbi:MAG TPA: hypothetical protein PKA90_16735, partial [Ignavibacteria bacterium]|nr:hypothetical protein [Ignavibacteria bacterium]HMR42064.1 hypothetical protein [Ignavibacteria bacterium]